MPSEHTDLVLARFFREFLPRSFAKESDFGRQSAQAVAWIVGLSVALLTLLLVNWDRVPFLPEKAAVTAAILLGSVIVSGVGQRMVQHVGERALGSLEKTAMGWLIGWTEGIPSPANLGEDWSREEIVGRFQSEFGLDYRFLTEYETPLEAEGVLFLVGIEVTSDLR